MSLLTFLAAAVLASAPAAPAPVYLADRPNLIAQSQQGWGELGINCCAHAAGVVALPLQIGDAVYARGLGTHAPGEIVVDLDGRFAAFDAEVGVERQPSGEGSVAFRVIADGQKRFDSGVLRETDAPRAVHLDVRGAQELRLVVTDGGDGILCDCANWADARLTPDPAARAAAPRVPFDVAPFARVVAWNPRRMDGARALRTQEFRAADLALETDLAPGRDGLLRAPVRAGAACIGLQWLERRRIVRAAIVFGARRAPRVPPGTRVEAWVGESPWQGAWKPVPGSIRASGPRWEIVVDAAAGSAGTRGTSRIRWIAPGSGLPGIARLAAYSATRTAVARLRVHVRGRRSARVEVTNGAVIGRGGAERRTAALPAGAASTDVAVRYARTGAGRADRTVLRFLLRSRMVSVAVDDVLAAGVVRVPIVGLTVSKAGVRIPAPTGATVLDRVRRMPDQTLAQAMRRTRNPIQDLGPTMLSLASDNRKFVAERDGRVRGDLALLSPVLVAGGAAGPVRLRRSLAGGWLPAPVVAGAVGGLEYTERVYVAPTAAGVPADPLWHEENPVCVVEITVRNPTGAAVPAELRLVVGPASAGAPPPAWRTGDAGCEAVAGATVVAAAGSPGTPWLSASVAGPDTLAFGGTVPAGASGTVRVTLGADAGFAARSNAIAAMPDLWDRFRAHWARVMAPAARIEVPDPLVANLIRASQVHCLIATRSEAEGRRLAAWAAASVYGALESESHAPIRGMDLMGHHAYARRALDYFVHRYNAAGYLTTGYTLMGTGWHLQALAEHAAVAGDAAWMRTVAPRVAHVCEWIVRQRHKTMRLDALGRRRPEYGLMPPGVMADWNAYAFYYCLNGYYCAGLRDAGRALAAAGWPAGARYAAEAGAMARDIRRAYAWTRDRSPVVALSDGSWHSPAPSQVAAPGPTNDYFPGDDGNRSWAYDVELGSHQLVPQGILPARSRTVSRMLDHMEDVDFLADGWFDYPGELSRRDWFNRGGFSKVQPYYCRNAEIYALRDDVKPFVRSYFNTMAAMISTENLSFWEHFRNNGAWNKTHETGYFLQQTRFMMAMERGRDLVLAPLVTCNWLRDGMTVAASRLPTRFGPVSYRIRSRAGSGVIEAVVDPPRRIPARAVTVRLRHPRGLRPTRVRVTGAAHGRVTWNAADVRVVGPVGRFRVVATYGSADPPRRTAASGGEGH